ncbi:MAG TPA: hypothetical protein VGE97_08765 [Nitrososphaera sp.]|jgi:hypothetical protein
MSLLNGIREGEQVEKVCKGNNLPRNIVKGCVWAKTRANPAGRTEFNATQASCNATNGRPIGYGT